MLRSRRTSLRSGTTMVETAFILPIFVMMVFGIFEYARYAFVRHVMDHAAREGARYAAVNTAEKTTAEIESYVRSRFATQAQQFTGTPTVQIFYANPSTGEPDSSRQWNDTPFGQAIGVRITGQYRVLLGGIVRLPSTFPMVATSLMRSEAN